MRGRTRENQVEKLGGHYFLPNCNMYLGIIGGDQRESKGGESQSILVDEWE